MWGHACPRLPSSLSQSSGRGMAEPRILTSIVAAADWPTTDRPIDEATHRSSDQAMNQATDSFKRFRIDRSNRTHPDHSLHHLFGLAGIARRNQLVWVLVSLVHSTPVSVSPLSPQIRARPPSPDPSRSPPRLNIYKFQYKYIQI